MQKDTQDEVLTLKNGFTLGLCILIYKGMLLGTTSYTGWEIYINNDGSLGQKRRFYFLFFQQRTQRILEWFAVLKPFRQYAVYAPRPSFDLVYLVKWSVLAKISFWSFLDNTGSSFCSFSFCYKTFFLTEILPDLLPSNICSITFMFHQIPEISRQVLLKQCLHYS